MARMGPPPNPNARRRGRALRAWVTPAERAELDAARLPGESWADAILRWARASAGVAALRGEEAP